MGPLANSPPSLNQGRLLILFGTLIWSLGGVFAKVLTVTTPLGVHVPPVDGPTMAFYRVLFAGLVLLPALQRGDLSFQPMMVPMVVSFAAMNGLYVSALALGSAANAIFLQYTAPMWMYLASVWWLGEKADRRNTVALCIGLAGVAIIVQGGWQNEDLGVVALGLGSGVAYAGVIIGLRINRAASSLWLTIVFHLGGALLLYPLIWKLPVPTWPQLAVLFLFGAIQMALPYWMVARGLRAVSPQEAGTITLLEPILNPFWVYLAAGEQPSQLTLLGGAFIVGALAWRYWPRKGIQAHG
jgi:drug/metabolite transporter (DMT)-like permease